MKRIYLILALCAFLPTSHAIGAERASARAWPGLGQVKTISMGEELKKAAPKTVTIFCSDPDCRELQADIDDALQIAGWDGEFESAFFPPDQPGILVGPPGPAAEKIAAALVAVGLGPVQIEDIAVKTDIGIMIGKRPR